MSDHPAWPQALVPHYPTGCSREIRLYTGPVKLHTSSGQMEGRGVLDVVWGTGADLVLDVSAKGSRIPDLDVVEVEFPEVGVESAVLIFRSNRHIDSSGGTLTLGGALRPTPFGNNSVVCMDFLVVNLRPVMGEAIEYEKGAVTGGRLSFEYGPWLLMVDSLEDSKDEFQRLEDQGGLGIFHSGRLTRLDGESFSPEAGEQVLHGLCLFMSFASGDWSPVFLPVGLDCRGEVVWRRWALPLCRPWSGRFSWLSPQRTDGLSESFAEMMRLLGQSSPGEAIQHLIYLYVEANGHVLMESRIVLARAALELRAWMHSYSTSEKPTDNPREALAGRYRRLPWGPRESPASGQTGGGSRVRRSPSD